MPSRPIRKKVILTAVVVLGLAVSAAIFTLRTPVFFEGALHRVGALVWRAENRLGSGTGSVFSFFRAKSSLVAENKEFEERISFLEQSRVDYAALERENRALKELLHRVPETHDLVLAYVLAKPNQTPYDTFIIDAGREDGIIAGDAVFAGGVSIIGEIETVYARTAKARLFSSPNMSVNVLLGEEGLALTARGLGNGTFSLEVPRDTAVEAGDDVFLPQRPPVFFGTVEAVGSGATDPVKIVLFRSAVNAAELKWIQVGRGMTARFEFDTASSSDEMIVPEDENALDD